MATTPKTLTLFFFLLLSSSLLQLHARESQFFSKFSNDNPKETPINPTNTQPQEEPNFIPQTQESAGYGLYRHLPPSTTTNAATNGGADDNLPTTLPENYNTVAYTSPIHSKDPYATVEPQYANINGYNDDNSMYDNQKQEQFEDNGRYYDNNGENIYSSQKQGTGENGGNMYYSWKQGMSETNTPSNMYDTEKHGMSYGRVLDNGRYNSQEQGMGETKFMDRWDGGNMYNSQKQGMSDTRFMENGKYYYDPNSESFNGNGELNSRGNAYNTRGYYGNNDNSNAQFPENQEDVFAP